MARGKKKTSKREEIVKRTRERARNKRRERQGASPLKYDGDWFEPRKQMVVTVLPFVLKIPNNLDNVEPGEEYFRLPYRTHRNLGTDGKTIVVSPTTAGKKCPICIYVDSLRKDWDENEDTIKAIGAKDREIYIVYDHKKKKVLPWDISYHLFGKQLDEEVESGDNEEAGFWIPDDKGFDLKLRFKEESYSGQSFLKINRIDFLERDKPVSKKLLKKAAEIDVNGMVDIMSFKELETLLHGSADIDEEEDENGNEETPDYEEMNTKELRKMAKQMGIDTKGLKREELIYELEALEPDEDEDDEEEEEETPECPHDFEFGVDFNDSKKCKKCKMWDECEESHEEMGEEEEEEEEKSSKNKKGKSGKKGKCPHKHEFGVDTDEYDDCEECSKWEACIEKRDED